jgi:hypothetical protein
LVVSEANPNEKILDYPEELGLILLRISSLRRGTARRALSGIRNQMSGIRSVGGGFAAGERALKHRSVFI